SPFLHRHLGSAHPGASTTTRRRTRLAWTNEVRGDFPGCVKYPKPWGRWARAAQFTRTVLNLALEPTPNSLPSPAPPPLGRGSPRAFGVVGVHHWQSRMISDNMILSFSKEDRSCHRYAQLLK